jgi:hypothetical protein
MTSLTRWLSVLAVGALLTPIAVAAGSSGAGASPGCGFRLGAIYTDRGAGQGAVDVPLIPAAPLQSCTTTVSASALISVAGGRPTNVAANPDGGAVTVAFDPYTIDPQVSWQLRPFCSDPSSVTFTATVDGMSESVAIGANSCVDYGGSSTLEAPTTLPQAGPVPFSAAAGTSTGKGLWALNSTGYVRVTGDATLYGSAVASAVPLVGLAPTPDGHGYWIVGSDGGVFSSGDATFYGSTGAMHLNQPIVGMAATPDGHGYWLVASDGGIFSFGDATFYGSTGAMHLNQPIVGMAATPDGRGYWLVASDGGIFSFGDARFHGSTGAMTLNQPVVGMAATTDGGGYWLVAADGGVFTFGDARYEGSAAGEPLGEPAIGLVPTPDDLGYWIVSQDNGVDAVGDATSLVFQQ